MFQPKVQDSIAQRFNQRNEARRPKNIAMLNLQRNILRRNGAEWNGASYRAAI
jgi:hypothetical protein